MLLLGVLLVTHHDLVDRSRRAGERLPLLAHGVILLRDVGRGHREVVLGCAALQDVDQLLIGELAKVSSDIVVRDRGLLHERVLFASRGGISAGEGSSSPHIAALRKINASHPTAPQMHPDAPRESRGGWDSETMRLFALEATRAFGEQVAASLEIQLDQHEERTFEDGEHKARPLVLVRGQDCYVVQSLHAGPEASAADKLIRLLFFAGALRQSGAARVTAVVPYLAYARKDRRTKPGDPVSSRYIAQLMEASGIDRLVTLETHNVVALENAFRVPVEHLTPYAPFADRASALAGGARLVVASPDPGGVKRAQLFRETLERRLDCGIGFALLEKRRSQGVVSGSLLAGDVDGATVIVLDDLISTGGTLVRASEALKAAGAEHVFAFAAHGLFIEGAPQLFKPGAIDRLVVGDTVPPFRLSAEARGRTVFIETAPLFAEAISRLQADASMTSLLQG